ncbi:MAG TPA: aminoglycoside 6-adenylyltransferase [candidate division Zixibacteria bacterium]|nr:aminoglycoside 6-adenylyltransferase [candidate division Zixibacteria bacterium]
MSSSYIPSSYTDIESRLVNWASTSPDVRAIVVYGSRALPTPPIGESASLPFDEFSDLDLVLFTISPSNFADNSKWLDTIAEVWLAGLENTGAGDPEWFVLFSGGFKVDIILLALEEDVPLTHLMNASPYKQVFENGMRIIYESPEDSAVKLHNPPVIPLTDSVQAVEFHHHVNLILMKVVKAMMLLRRGELFNSLSVLDCQLRPRVLELIMMHAKATGNDAPASKIQHRFLEQWINPDLLVDYSKTFSTYDPGRIRNALLASTRLVSRLASEIAEVAEIRFPDDGQSNTLNWLRFELENQQAEQPPS